MVNFYRYTIFYINDDIIDCVLAVSRHSECANALLYYGADHLILWGRDCFFRKKTGKEKKLAMIIGNCWL